MERLRNGIYATAMNNYIMDMYEEIEDEDNATMLLEDWFSVGVPDGNDLEDNINDFGDNEDLFDLQKTFYRICKMYSLCPDFSKYIEEIKKNIVEMLDNPYCVMV